MVKEPMQPSPLEDAASAFGVLPEGAKTSTTSLVGCELKEVTILTPSHVSLSSSL
jgi:hypothetical protein